MPYKDKQKQREYQQEWYRQNVKARHDEWIAKNGPCTECGSWDGLEVDHIDPTTKDDSFRGTNHSGTFKVFGWSEERREAELAKCTIRCRKCHIEKSRGEVLHGEEKVEARLTEANIGEIRTSTEPRVVLAERFGVTVTHVGKIQRKERWAHI